METQITIVNDCSLDRVGPDYMAIIEDAVGAYRRNLDKLLLSVRLMGSVPRGEAVFGSSDIDFVALVAMNPGLTNATCLHRNPSDCLGSTHASVTWIWKSK